MTIQYRTLRYPFHSLLVTAVIAAAAGCTPQSSGDAAPVIADLALRDGAIYTMDGARSWAEAVAIRAGSIVYVGSDSGLQAHIGPATRVIDLRGRMLLPAFQDAHVHPITSGIQANSCDLSGLQTIDAYIAAIRKYADAHPDEAWISGGGWLMSAFGPGALASRKLLDAIVPNRPVYLESADGHTVWVNSKALAAAGITDQTPDPPGGRIDRDRHGTAVGSLQEGAGALVYSVMPPPTDAQRQAALGYSIKLLNGYGITAVDDALVYEDDLKTYQALDRRGELSLHVAASILWDRDQGLEQLANIERLRSQYTTGNVVAHTVKIFMDGVMENYAAALLEPYLVPGHVRGMTMIDAEHLQSIVIRLDADDFQLHFHAIGDAAIREALDAIAAARRANGDRDHRHHIAHLELIDPADIPRFRELGVVANFQPLWAYADAYITDLTIPFLGPKRSQWLYPIGSVYRSGAVIAFGSDWSVSSANPLEEIETAVTRMGSLGETKTPFLPAQRIDLPEAIAAFTINAAYVNHLEQQTGSVEVGKYADLVVLDHNLFAIPPEKISDVQALVTLFEGKVVHGDLGRL